MPLAYSSASKMAIKESSMATGRADVYLGEILAGHIAQDLERSVFSYEKNFGSSLCVAMGSPYDSPFQNPHTTLRGLSSIRSLQTFCRKAFA